jgi:hypothetical protein
MARAALEIKPLFQTDWSIDMRKTSLLFVGLLAFGWANFAAGQTDVELMTAEMQPEIQEQINGVYNIFLTAARDDLKTNCEAFEEIQKLKEITANKGEIVKQLAIFTAITESEEDTHVLHVGMMLHLLDLPPSIPIRVLAPYLDAENEKLRDFARGWFHGHDSDDSVHGLPPLGSVNYHDYMEYVRSRLDRNEEIPAGFIKFIYERHPGKALLVFAYAHRQTGAVERLQEIHKALEARRQGRELTPEEIRQSRERRRQHQLRQQKRKQRLWEILLAEHTVSNAIWLKENDLFPHRFQAALPEATVQLQELAKKEWWARLYVVYIMRQHRELRMNGVLQQLRDDRNELVREAAQATPQ